MFVCKMMYMIAAMKLAIWNSLIKDGNYSIILQARLYVILFTGIQNNGKLASHSIKVQYLGIDCVMKYIRI